MKKIMMMKEGMLKDLPGKFRKLNLFEESLIKKLGRIKKTTETSDAKGESFLVPDISDQLKKTQEEVTKKIEEFVNSKSEQIKTNEEAMKNLELKLSKINQTALSSNKITDELKERLNKIDETVLDLLSLYEIVSSTVNPFVDGKVNPITKELEDIEKKLEELSQKTPEIPLNLKEDFENKFKSLENSIEELKKIENLEEALVEKVTETVIERIKPIVQRTVLTGISSNLQPSPSSQSNPPPQLKPKTSQNIDEEDQGVRLPYLDNKPETSIILLNWIEFLLEKVGRNNLIDILEYYVEIGWINEEISSKMMAYASGIDYTVEKPTWKLLPEDHTRSLLFIEQLRGRKIDNNLLSKIERDVDKVIHSEKILML